MDEQEFLQPFDMSNLDENEIGHLEFIMNSPSWQRVFRPFIQRCHNQFIDYLLDPRKDKKISNEDLIAGARLSRHMLEFFDKIVNETNHERAVAAARAITPTGPRIRAGAVVEREDY